MRHDEEYLETSFEKQNGLVSKFPLQSPYENSSVCAIFVFISAVFKQLRENRKQIAFVSNKAWLIKARFRGRTFHEPNLIHCIKYMKSSASESIRNACFDLEQLSGTEFRLWSVFETALIQRPNFSRPNLMHKLLELILQWWIHTFRLAGSRSSRPWDKRGGGGLQKNFFFDP